MACKIKFEIYTKPILYTLYTQKYLYCLKHSVINKHYLLLSSSVTIVKAEQLLSLWYYQSYYSTLSENHKLLRLFQAIHPQQHLLKAQLILIKLLFLNNA